MKRKRSLGLCFSYDDKFAPGHKCKQPQLFIVESAQDGDNSDEDQNEEEQQPEISLHALTGWDTPSTLRLHTKIEQQHLLALVGSGSTHSFISDKAAHRLHLSAMHTTPFTVQVANGTPLKCHQRYEAVTMRIGTVSFTITLHVLPLAGLNIVLGVKWLETLGPTICDWKAQSIQIMWEGQTHLLQGVQAATIHAIGPQEIIKEARQGHLLYALCLSDTETQIPQVADDLKALIHDFDDLFQAPTGLPPHCKIEHTITLKEGNDPVKVRPYRYAHFQKEEIERQVEDMLKSGIVRTSSSPFSSPVLLVKKKDGTWRFCTDYRALNAATIKDRFPIPTVDDMLDELHGTAYFTKLDLTVGYHQVLLNPNDISKTAFQTHNRHYKYLVMPFGLCNTPSTFQALMNSIFWPLMRKSVLVFFDDILIYSSDWESHLRHVHEVFRLLREHKLAVKLKNCDFGREELEYLGHIISRQGVKVDQSKVQAMLDWSPPTNIT